jgi:hypothetical protein
LSRHSCSGDAASTTSPIPCSIVSHTFKHKSITAGVVAPIGRLVGSRRFQILGCQLRSGVIILICSCVQYTVTGRIKCSHLWADSSSHSSNPFIFARMPYTLRLRALRAKINADAVKAGGCTIPPLSGCIRPPADTVYSTTTVSGTHSTRSPKIFRQVERGRGCVPFSSPQ